MAVNKLCNVSSMFAQMLGSERRYATWTAHHWISILRESGFRSAPLQQCQDVPLSLRYLIRQEAQITIGNFLKLHSSPWQRQSEALRLVASSGPSMLGPDSATLRINNDDASFQMAHSMRPMSTNHHIPKPLEYHDRDARRPESEFHRPVSSAYSNTPTSCKGCTLH